jgi:hypothetical protein
MKMQNRTGQILVRVALVVASVTLVNGAMLAQSAFTHKLPSVDVAVTYQTLRSDHVSDGSSFFQQGGAVELHARLFGGLGVVASVTGEHASTGATGAAPISFVSTVFGPRYTFAPRRRTSVFVEAMAGEISAFQSSFPPITGSTPLTNANSVAVLTGGGIDLNLDRRFAIRAVQVDWLHTQLPNGGGNTQNNLRLGAGVVVRFGR